MQFIENNADTVQVAFSDISGASLNDPWVLWLTMAAMLLLLGIVLVLLLNSRRLMKREGQLFESMQQYQSLFENHSDAIVSIDLNGRILSANEMLEKLTGYKPKELQGMLITREGFIRDSDDMIRHFALTDSREPQRFETELRHKNGHVVEIGVHSVPIIIGDRITGVYVMIQDITVIKQAERKIYYLAYHDHLTGLTNRSYVLERLNKGTLPFQLTELAQLMVLDLDQFKRINDSLGPNIADKVLKQFAERLTMLYPENAVISRIGGDEFMVLLTGIRDAEHAQQEAEALQAYLMLPYKQGTQHIHLSISIGYAFSEEKEQVNNALLQCAETALFHSKRLGKNRILPYTDNLDQDSGHRLDLENGLRLALERNEFDAFYQPQFDMEGRLIGAEALVRWNHPEKGRISPCVFIPVAEESGLINPIGERILLMACLQNKRWQEVGYPRIPVSVNLSIKQFEQPDLIERIVKILEQSKLDPHYLELEITESMAMDFQNAEEKLRELKALGVKISMDDFGTGYSSLSFLYRFPIDKLKIDQSFVRDITLEKKGAPIVATIVAMAHHLNLSVIAEGVETQEQLDFLKSQSCDQVQGYYYSPPIPASEFTRFLGQSAEFSHEAAQL